MRIFFDVHGTLLSTDERTLRPGTAELLHELTEAGHEVTLWSTAGSGYARVFAHRFGLLPYVFECISKRDLVQAPDVCVDDLEDFLIGAKGNVRVTPFRGDVQDRELERVRGLVTEIERSSPRKPDETSKKDQC